MNSIAQATGKSVTTITDMAKKAEEEKRKEEVTQVI